MLHKKQKPSLKPTERPGQTRHTKPHKPMNCERAVRHRRTALSQFGGRGGTGPPTKKMRGGTGSPTKKLLGTKSAILTLFMRWHFGRPYFVGKEHNGEDHYIDGTGT